MVLMDERTEKLLDIQRVLAELHPVTPFGSRCKGEMKPFFPRQKQELLEELRRIEEVRELMEDQKDTFIELRSHLRLIKDIRKSVERCIEGGVLNEVELFELKNFSYVVNELAEDQKLLDWNIPSKYKIEKMPWLDELLDPEDSGIKTFYIYDCYSKKLRHTRLEKSRTEQLLDSLKRERAARIEEELGVKLKASGEITLTRNQSELTAKLQAHPLLQISSESYMSKTFRLRPDEDMLSYMKRLEQLNGEESLEEARVLEELSEKLGAQGSKIIQNINAIGEFDLIMAKAQLALAQNAIKPIITENSVFEVNAGRHPLVEASLRKKGRSYTPISVSLEKGVTLITGANMGGKTVSLKLFGLLAAMVQYGLLVPVEHMVTRLFEFIFISAGDEQSIDLGLSTFGAEMKGIKEVLERSGKPGLILIDELARGTNPQEGFAISGAIIHYLMKKPCISIITTHFDGLIKPGIRHLQVNGLRNAELSSIKDPEDIGEYMDFRLVEAAGKADVPRDALNISRLMGIPREIINYAELLLNEDKNLLP